MTALPRIGRPATRALASLGVTTLEDALALGDDALLALHGFGPRALALLRAAATERSEPAQSVRSVRSVRPVRTTPSTTKA